MAIMDTYDLINTLIRRLKQTRENTSNSISFNSALDDAIVKLTDLKKYF